MLSGASLPHGGETADGLRSFRKKRDHSAKFKKLWRMCYMKEPLFGDLCVIAMPGCEEFAERVDSYLKE